MQPILHAREQAQHEATAREIAEQIHLHYGRDLPHNLFESLRPAVEAQLAWVEQRILSALTAATAQQAQKYAALEASVVDKITDAHGCAQESTIRDVNAGLIDDLIAPRLAQQADEIARLTAVVDSLRELQHQDEDRLAARDAEIARLKAALRELSGDASEDWRYPNTANLRRAARAALSEGTRT